MNGIQINLLANAKSPAERVRALRSRVLGLSREQVSNTPNVTVSATMLKNWETAHTDVTPRIAKKIVDMFKVFDIQLTEKWVLTGEGLDSDELSTPLVYDKSQQDIASALSFSMQLDAFLASSEKVVTYTITENSFCLLRKGDIVGGYLREDTDLDDLVGELCICIDKQGFKGFGQVTKSKNDNYYIATLKTESGIEIKVDTGFKIKKAAPLLRLFREEKQQ